MLKDKTSLEAVEKRNPRQVAECQHESKTIVYNVHCSQYGLLTAIKA